MTKKLNILSLLLLIGLSTIFSPITAQTSILDRSQLKNQTTIFQSNDPKPAHEVFKPALHYDDDSKEVQIIWDVDPQHYLYKEKISIDLLNDNLSIREISLPQGVDHYDEFFGHQEIYDHPFSMPLELEGDLSQVGTLHITVTAQGCAKSGFCYAPYEWSLSTLIHSDIKDDRLKTDSTTVDTHEIIVPLGEHDRLTQILINNQFLSLPLFFLLGLLLTFTPCVLPMLPILSGILTSQSRNEKLTAKEGFKISLVYVLAMASVYTLLGLIAAWLGEGLAAYMQHPYVLTGFALIFLFLALSMFDLYQLQMPSAIQTKLNALSSRQHAKRNYSGIIVMGMLSALIVGPCVTAPLIGIITLIAQTQNYFLGASALFSMSMGMGVPLLILGASSGHLLPKAGHWMNQVKILFGFMLLGLAAYFFGRTLSNFWEQMLYALIALATFIWLIIQMTTNRSGRLFFGAISLIVLIFGIDTMNEAKRPIDLPNFDNIKGIKGLNIALTQSPTAITMLEFNAGWCVACKEMEKYVFSQAEVKKSLQPLTLLTTDVTDNDREDQTLLKHFNLYGPPAILFFNRQGVELTQYRIVGSVSKEQFIEHIERLIKEYR